MLAAAEEEEEEARSQTDGLAACKPTHVSPLLTTTVLTQPAAPSTSTQQKAQKSLPKYHKVSYFSLIFFNQIVSFFTHSTEQALAAREPSRSRQGKDFMDQST